MWWQEQLLHHLWTLGSWAAAGGTVSSLGISVCLFGTVTGICLLSSLLFVGQGLNSLADLCPVSNPHTHSGLCSSDSPWPGRITCFPQTSLMHFFLALAPATGCAEHVCLTHTDLFFQAQFRNPFFLEAFCDFTILILLMPPFFGHSLNSIALLGSNYNSVALTGSPVCPLLDSKHLEGKDHVKHISVSLASLPEPGRNCKLNTFWFNK